MRSKNAFVLGFLAVMLTLAGTIGFTGTAAAASQPREVAGDQIGVAAACRGNSCSYKEPVSQGCTADAKTMSSIVVLGAAARQFLIQTRYSPACDATWTHISNRNNPDCTIGTYAWHEGSTTGGGQYSRTPNVHVGPSCSNWTVMLGTADKSTRACAYSTWESRNRCDKWW